MNYPVTIRVLAQSFANDRGSIHSARCPIPHCGIPASVLILKHKPEPSVKACSHFVAVEGGNSGESNIIFARED